MIVHTFKKFMMPILYFAVLYFSLYWLNVNEIITTIANYTMLAVLAIFGALFVSAIFIFIINRVLEKKGGKARSLKWIAVVVKILIWATALLLVLDNIGVQVTTLVAGLGIGGLALAFAAQAILQDIFSFVTIFFDRPFEINDFIVVGDLRGTVEHIGVKTTRLRSISGEQLIFSNRDLTDSRIRNYKRMENRRVLFTLGVTYNTTSETLEEIPGIIKEIILSVENTTFDRAHFKELADFSLNFEVVYYVMSQDYKVYMDVHHKINIVIKKTFDEKGIEFAFPTQTVYIEK
jgi:small-conductance mechanosensitive channel